MPISVACVTASISHYPYLYQREAYTFLPYPSCDCNAGSPCSDFSKNLTYTAMPPRPGSLLNVTDPHALPPAQGPAPVLEPADVVDPLLPPVTVGGHGAALSSNDSSTKSGATTAGTSSGLCLLVAGLAALLAVSSR
jgi:hypothetical protein